MQYKLKVNRKFSISVLVLFFLLAGSTVFGQTTQTKILFKGPTTTIAPQSEFPVSILISSKDPINAFDLEVTYPKDKLEFLDFDNTGSIVNIWQPRPEVLPSGNLRISGGIIKGFTGENGLILKLSFKALNSNTSQISFVKSNIYLADGKATELNLGSAPFSIAVKESGTPIFAPIVPFQSTPSDILIQAELETYKKDVFWQKMFTPMLILGISIFVILIFAVYNKRKRKQ